MDWLLRLISFVHIVIEINANEQLNVTRCFDCYLLEGYSRYIPNSEHCSVNFMYFFNGCIKLRNHLFAMILYCLRRDLWTMYMVWNFGLKFQLNLRKKLVEPVLSSTSNPVECDLSRPDFPWHIFTSLIIFLLVNRKKMKRMLYQHNFFFVSSVVNIKCPKISMVSFTFLFCGSWRQSLE